MTMAVHKSIFDRTENIQTYKKPSTLASGRFDETITTPINNYIVIVFIEKIKTFGGK